MSLAERLETQVESCCDVLERLYLPAIVAAVQRGQSSIAIDIHHISDLGLMTLILDEPREALALFKIALARLGLTMPKEFGVEFVNLPASNHVPIGAIRTEHLNRLISVEGLVRTETDYVGEITLITFECPLCATPTTLIQEGGLVVEPARCANASCRGRGKFRRLREELTNLYSLVLEETPETLNHAAQPARLHVKCRGALALPGMSKLPIGQRAAITGILREMPQTTKDKTTTVRWYLDANSVQVLGETFADLRWTEEDVQEFRRLAAQPGWLRQLRHTIFADVHGHEEECEALVLQLFGCVGKQRPGKSVRGQWHILLVGDAGCAKSTLLTIAQRFAPKAMFISASGLSAAGIEGGAVKDELLGTWALEAGALALCNNGLACIDELDKTDEATRGHLHTAMEQELVSIHKIVKGTFVTKTAILAACNPKHGTFSAFDGLFVQIDLTPTLINRFDLVYPMLGDDVTADDDKAIMQKLLGQHYGEPEDQGQLSATIIKKFIAYARTLTPTLPPALQEYAVTWYHDMRAAKRQMKDGGPSIPVTPRNAESLLRIAEAVARARLHTIITEEDLQVAERKIMYCMRRLGVDPSTGQTVESIVAGPGGATLPRMAKDIEAHLLAFFRSKGKTGATRAEINFFLSTSLNLADAEVIDRTLAKLKARGDIFEPRYGHYASTETI